MKPSVLNAAAIHKLLSGRWPETLKACGVSDEYLTGKHCPCPACGGRDRFRFTDKGGEGMFICAHCGAGDGFALLRLIHGWSFAETRRTVIEVMGLGGASLQSREPSRRRQSHDQVPVRLSVRVRNLLAATVSPERVQDTVRYLASRKLWPLPDGCEWRAHEGIEYWDNWKKIGRFPALVAEVKDIEGDLVTAHVTYLCGGRKLDTYAPRKILSRLTGRRGCAVRLMPVLGEVLGVAEGIETALAAHNFHGISVWAALNTALLAKFIPPPEVNRLIIFADRDDAGIDAANRLCSALESRCSVELSLPPVNYNDWADVLMEKTQ